MKRNRVSIRGLAFLDVGAGPTILLIHAFGFDAGMWQPQIDHMRSLGWRVIAPDLRGFGESPGPTADHSFDETVADVVGLLDDAQVDRAVVCGLSMGAATAVALAVAHPHRVAGLLIADNSRPDGIERATAASERILRIGMTALSDVYEPILFSDAYRARAPDAIARWRRALIARDPAQLAKVVMAYHDRPDPGPHLVDITAPATIVYGVDDVAIPEDRRMDYTPIPDAVVHRIPNAGHMSNMEQPEVFNSALAELALRSLGKDWRGEGRIT